MEFWVLYFLDTDSFVSHIICYTLSHSCKYLGVKYRLVWICLKYSCKGTMTTKCWFKVLISQHISCMSLFRSDLNSRVSISTENCLFLKPSLSLQAPEAWEWKSSTLACYYRNIYIYFLNVQCCWALNAAFRRKDVGGRHTVDSGEQHSRMVVGNHVGISVLWFVDLQVRVLPRELLTRIDGLWRRRVFVIMV